MFQMPHAVKTAIEVFQCQRTEDGDTKPFFDCVRDLQRYIESAHCREQYLNGRKKRKRNYYSNSAAYYEYNPKNLYTAASMVSKSVPSMTNLHQRIGHNSAEMASNTFWNDGMF